MSGKEAVRPLGSQKALQAVSLADRNLSIALAARYFASAAREAFVPRLAPNHSTAVLERRKVSAPYLGGRVKRKCDVIDTRLGKGGADCLDYWD